MLASKLDAYHASLLHDSIINGFSRFFLIIGILLGVLALEASFYSSYYFVFSFMSFFLLFLSSLAFSNGKFLYSGLGNYVAFFLVYYFFYHCLVAFSHGDFVGFFRFVGAPFVVSAVLMLSGNVHNLLKLFVIISFFLSIISLFVQLNYGFFWDLKFGRNASIFFDPNYAGAFFGAAFITSILFERSAFSYLVRGFLLLATVFTFSKAALLSIFVAYVSRQIVLGKYLFSFFFSLLFVFSVLYVYSIFGGGMFRIDQGLNSRDSLLFFTVDFVGDIFYLGAPPAEVQLGFEESGIKNRSAHNFFLDNLLRYGIPSLLMNIFLVFYVFIKGALQKNILLPLAIFFIFVSNSIVISYFSFGFLSFLYTVSVVFIIFGRYQRVMYF
jgi:hypothetical protein